MQIEIHLPPAGLKTRGGDPVEQSDLTERKSMNTGNYIALGASAFLKMSSVV